MPDGKKTITLAGHSPCGVDAFTFSPTGKTIISLGLGDEKIKIWDLATGKVNMTIDVQFDDFNLGGSAFSSNGKLLALRCRHDKVRVFDVMPY